MFEEVFKIILIGSIPIFLFFLILKKKFGLKEIPINLLIVISMLIVSLCELYCIKKGLELGYLNLFFKLKLY